jgi:hypothetical protein
MIWQAESRLFPNLLTGYVMGISNTKKAAPSGAASIINIVI